MTACHIGPVARAIDSTIGLSFDKLGPLHEIRTMRLWLG